MKYKRTIRAASGFKMVLLAAAIVLAFVGMALAAAEQQPKRGGIWKDALSTNPPELDPIIATDTTSAEVGYQLFETLVEISPDGDLVPLLAESWEVKDGGKRFIFHLRKGVRFHSKTEGGKWTANAGREVTAYDWVWSLNYLADPKVNSPRAYFIDMVKGYDDYRKGKTKEIAGIRAVDRWTLQIELDYPFAAFLGVVAYNSLVVLPREDVAKLGKNFNFHPVGTGPFVFESWKQDDKLVLSRNNAYWKKDKWGNQLPYLNGIEYRIIVDENIQYTEFKLGNLYQTVVTDPYYQEAKSGKVGVFKEIPQPGTYYYGMNITSPPFNDKRIRQALNYAIDRKKLIDLVRNGRATPAKGVLPPGMPGYNPNLKGYDYNPQKAKELLAAAGYKNGVDVTLVYNTSVIHKPVAEALQAQFAQVGIRVTLRNIDWGTLLDMADRGDVPFFRMEWVVDYLDPDNFLYVLLNSANIGPKGNYTWFKNAEFDKLTDEARVEPDWKKRIALYQKAEQIAVEEAPWVFIYHYNTDSLVQSFVRNYELPSFGQYANKFREVWLDR